ncbi:hypothetical protein AC1031_011906 [Aphanomyces cochlioides]|nr:hypothetical protein AC1031_011906 [Aphanomyces cochlioides]
MSWCGTRLTGEQAANAAVLCAAMSSKEFGAFLDSDPSALSLAEGLDLPPLFASDEMTVVESKQSIFCCVKPTHIPQQLIDVTERQTTFRYGGRVHTAFNKRAKRILALLQRPYDPQTSRLSLLDFARKQSKPMVFCGHALTGGIAHVCLLELVYAALPHELRVKFEAVDTAHQQIPHPDNLSQLEAQLDDALTNNTTSIGLDVRSIAFGAPYVATTSCAQLLRSLKIQQNLLTVVNEFDCMPNIFDVAQTSALISTTTSRVISISKATGVLLGLLPTVERVAEARNVPMQLAVSAYTTMTWEIVHKAFVAFQKRVLEKAWDGVGDYKPLGQYVILAKDSLGVQLLEGDSVVELLRRDMQALTGRALWQHIMAAYVTQVSKRTQGCSATMNHYERLHVDMNATTKEIRSAYKTQALKWHPDRWSMADAADRKRAEAMFKLLAEAYEVLSDADAKAKYDQTLEKETKLSWSDEFFHHGTVQGKSLDEAMAVFKTVSDTWGRTLSRFSTGNGVVVVPKSNPRFLGNNHDNLFAPDKMRVVRRDQTVTYVASDEMLITDKAASTRASSDVLRGAATMVGGAVLVGAGIAVVVRAWSQYSDNTRRERQADAVREMSFPLLHRLLMDASSTSETALMVQDSKDVVPRQENVSTECLDEFYDCLDEVEWATLHQQGEDDFFDCIATIQDEDVDFTFPQGAFVTTPFGVGSVVHETNGVYAVELPKLGVAHVQRIHVTRGASAMVELKETKLEGKRRQLAERVIQAYGLANATSLDTTSMLAAGKDAAIDSGMKAAGGVALASGLECVVPGLGAAAAPLTVAAILVDIGREYMEYREKKPLTAASERLSMQSFRLKAGQHVASGSAAAAGASLGLYGVSSAVGYWTGAAAMGPLGLVAATSAAVVGGILGYAVGSSAYAGSTASYFTSLQDSSAEIDRLELGAKVLFTQYDPNGTGCISKDDCKQLISQLCADVSESGYTRAIAILDAPGFEGPITWSMFWDWVSSEAVKKLDRLQQADKKAQGSSWWSHYQAYFAYSSRPNAEVAPCCPTLTMYPSVHAALKFRQKEVVKDIAIHLAQVDALAERNWLGSDDAYQLKLYLQSDDEDLQRQAQVTIQKLEQAFSIENEDTAHVEISSAFSAVDDNQKHREHVDAMCSLLSKRGLGKLLLENRIESPANARREDLHALALAYLTQEE